MRRINADIVIALLLLIGCAAFFTETFRYQKVNLAIVGSKLWPRVAVVALFFFAVVYLFESLRAGPRSETDAWSLKQWFTVNRNVLICFVVFGLFLAGLPYLGMLISGILFVFITLTLLGKSDTRGHLIHAAVAIISVGFMWAVFTFALGVILPQGVLLPRF